MQSPTAGRREDDRHTVAATDVQGRKSDGARVRLIVKLLPGQPSIFEDEGGCAWPLCRMAPQVVDERAIVVVERWRNVSVVVGKPRALRHVGPIYALARRRFKPGVARHRDTE